MVYFVLFFLIGDYKDDFLKAVGWNQQKNPDNLPAGLIPGSDDEDEEEEEDNNIDELLTRLSLNSEETDFPQEQEQDYSTVAIFEDDEVEEAEEMRFVIPMDVIIQNNIPDPRGGNQMRTRIVCRAILPSGVNAETIKVANDREKHEVVLTGEYLKSLLIASESMCALYNNDMFQLHLPYQEYLNTWKNPSFTMIGFLPRHF